MIAKAIDSYGDDSRELFHRAGLDYDRLHQPLARYSYASIQRLWALAVDATGDACFGLRVSSFWHPTTFHALGYSWLASRNLAEGFDRLPSGRVDEGDIAASINLSRRSLQRKLQQQGVSFNGLLDSSRQELGLQYVRDSQYSLNEVAYLLGFSEPGNFSRAFKRCYGKPPSQYREQT